MLLRPPCILLPAVMLLLASCGAGEDEVAPGTAILTVEKSGEADGVVTSDPAGINCGDICDAEFEQGALVTLDVELGSDADGLEWEGCDERVDNTCKVRIYDDTVLAVRFDARQDDEDAGEGDEDQEAAHFQLQVLREGVGQGTVTSDPAGIDCSVSGAPGCTQQFPLGTGVTLEARPDTGYMFAGWSGDCTGVDACVLMMDGHRQVTATFSQAQHALRIEVADAGVGRVYNVNDLGDGNPVVDCVGDCLYHYPHGLAIGLRAQPLDSSEHEFVVWEGDCSGLGTCNLAMDGDRTATARFRLVPPTIMGFAADRSALTRGEDQAAVLSWDISGGGAIVTTLDSDNDPDVQGVDVTGSTSFEITPDETTTYVLTARNDSGEEQRSVTVLVGSRPEVMTFAPTPGTEAVRPHAQAELVWEVEGDGDIDIVIVNDETGEELISTRNKSGSATHAPDSQTSYTLTATSRFGEATARATVSMLRRLTLSKSGTGQGTVTSEPPGIDCRSNCNSATADFREGENVTLTASFGAPMRFDGFSGCDSTPRRNQCRISMDEDRSVTARFGFWVLSVDADVTASRLVSSADAIIGRALPVELERTQ